jgi:hypothetical protein
MSERISGLASALFQATTRRLGAMSASGTTVSPCGNAWGSGASGANPIAPLQKTACTHSLTVRTTGPSRSVPPGVVQFQ